MSLRNQPYFPLYVQDYLTDEKLNECSAQTQGVYIKLMCLMHKSDDYGKILLKQKDKQNENQILNFAIKIVKHLPFREKIIISSIEELIDENVLFIKGDYLCQKRMIKDNDISIKRAKAGKKGGKSTQNKHIFAKPNNEPNSEDEDESESEYKNKETYHLDNAYDFLKIKEAHDIEIFEMQNKKSFGGDFEKFIVNFNSIIIENDVKWEPKILLARLYRLNMNWDKTPKGNKPLTAVENLDIALKKIN